MRKDFFLYVCLLSGVCILAILSSVLIFLGLQALPVLTNPDLVLPSGSVGIWDYVVPLGFGSIWVSFLALLLAVPFSIYFALFTTFYIPQGLSKLVGRVVDFLGAVHSIVFGLWGVTVIAPALVPVYEWLGTHFPWLPFFTGNISTTGRTVFTAAVILAVMALPIITALCREIFFQIPRFLIEGAFALGATRFEVMKLVVIPLSKAGIVSAAVLGLGRAIGETIAVALILSSSGVINFSLIAAQAPSTIAANIALQFPEAQGNLLAALIASGLVLFVVSFLINLVARKITNRQIKVLRGI
ncbi:phosphate ABC transporter permease subunit PstC [Tropheryma whipplei]|uniref:Phosphate transport system permease protein n=1 Tax=Tropheryma whipplei (strain Twist) TaxID=203267 RepID=Q83MX0_TROWT|nr:phosphate ABC transporter permease subunit PstC [Tropheryma whipplei]AAO44451.1 phosphate transport system permease protein [Tropheryma whipplei str. Twist]